MQKEEHILSSIIEKYLKGELKKNQISEVENHLMKCTECSVKLDSLKDFSSLWDKWTAKEHGEAYQKADKKMIVDIQKALSERRAQILIEKLSDMITKSPTHLKKTMDGIKQHISEILMNTFTYPAPSFAPAFGEYLPTVLSPFGKVRYPIIFKWQPYERADKYRISIEEADWSFTTTGTKVKVSAKELSLVYGGEYMWELKVIGGREEILEEESGFFSLPSNEELKELVNIESQLGLVKPEEAKCILGGGILEDRSFYMGAIEKYKRAYAIESTPGVAYRIACCYDKLELEELREEWNKKIS